MARSFKTDMQFKQEDRPRLAAYRRARMLENQGLRGRQGLPVADLEDDDSDMVLLDEAHNYAEAH